ncbi:MAG: helix-turn-helix domain-containing protein [Opitutales bacterium]
MQFTKMQQAISNPAGLDSSSCEPVFTALDRLRLQPVSITYWQNQPGWALRERRVPDSFWLMPLEGTLRVWLPERTETFRLTPGHALHLPPGALHALSLEAGAACLRQIAVHAHLDHPAGYPVLAGFRRWWGSLGQPDYWHSRLTALASLQQRDRERVRPLFTALFQTWLAERILRGGDWQPPGAVTGDPRVTRAISQIRAAPDHPWTVETLARSADLTTVRFRQLFRAQTGRSPKAWLNAFRLERAARLLRETGQPVKRIREASGFPTDRTFFHAFQAAFGCSPGAYRTAPPERL